ncbi:MAG: SDR family oxidoreductase [Bacteroidota bacterium]
MRNVKNSVVWVTGASSGLGEALTYQLAAEGARLVITSNEPEGLARVAQKTGLAADKILVLPATLENFDADDLTKKVIAHFGTIDILINNAGVLQKAFFEDTNEEIERKIMEINYFASIKLTRAALPYIKQQKGMVVAVGSLNGRVGAPWMTTYCASKYATIGFFESLRYELLKDKVQVLIIIPGFMNTDITLNAWTGDGSKYGQNSITQKIGMTVDVCARKISNAIKSDRRNLLVGRWEHLFPYIRMACPPFFFWLFRKMHKL